MILVNKWEQSAGALSIDIIIYFVIFFIIYLWKCTHDD